MFVQLFLRVSILGAPPQKKFEARPHKNQKAFAYGTGAGGGSHLANQEASGAGKAFAYGTGAGGGSHLVDQEASGTGKTAGAGKAFAYGMGTGGSLRMANQEATGAGKAFSYGTDAGGGSHLADQEASGTGKAFAYVTSARGYSHLVKLRDGARHCNSALGLSFCCEFSLGRLRRQKRDPVHRALRGAARWHAAL